MGIVKKKLQKKKKKIVWRSCLAHPQQKTPSIIMFKSAFARATRIWWTGARLSTPEFANHSRPYASVNVTRLRKTLNQFLLKVHPDFFTAYPTMQSINEKSLKQLNSFLDVLENHSGPGKFRKNLTNNNN